MKRFRILYATVLSLVVIGVQAQDGKLPIIDMHMHASDKMWRTETGEPLPI